MTAAKALLSFVILSSSVLVGQVDCRLEPLQIKPVPGNFFTEQQEEILGEMAAAQYQQTTRIVRDEALAAYLRQVGERIVAQFPTTMRFRFELIELGEANAFSLPGGRIYISRKLIAQMRSEDELAAVLAHELGHSLTRQSAALISRMMRKILKIEALTGPDDVRARYHELLNNQGRKTFRSNMESEQGDADLVAVQALSRAGYDPQALAAFFERFSEAKVVKRGFFNLLFGARSPDTKRLMAMQKGLAKRPPACIAPVLKSPEAFGAWRDGVVAYSNAEAGLESLNGLVWKRKLSPALHSPVHHIRYSPDGSYLLAQDGGTIHVLTREPFAPLFRIQASGAFPAFFSPDSQTISFYDNSDEPRIETWSVAEKKRLFVRELHLRTSCAESILARDGKVLACVVQNDKEYGYDLVLYDVSAATEIVRKKLFLDFEVLRQISIQRMQLLTIAAEMSFQSAVDMEFTPDGRYFLAARGDAAFCFDLVEKIILKLPSSVLNEVRFGFAFLGSDQILGRHLGANAAGTILSFPSGQVVKPSLQFGISRLSPSSSPAHVFLRPVQGFAVGVFDTSQNKYVLGGKKTAIDVWQTEYAAEETDGKIVRAAIVDQTVKAELLLTDGDLGNVYAASTTPDLSWLTFSDHERAGVWNLATGTRRFHLPNFDGSYFNGGSIYLDTPPREKSERSMTAINIANAKATITKLPADEAAIQFGPVMIVTKSTEPTRPREKKKSSSDSGIKLAVNTPRSMFAWSYAKHFEFRDVVTQKVLWTKAFPEGRSWEAHPELDSIAFFKLDSKGVYLIEFDQLTTGNRIGDLKIDTGKVSYLLNDAFFAGKYFVVSDTQRRITVYRQDGTPVVSVFGRRPLLAPDTGLLAVRSEYDQVALYDVANGNQVELLQFARRVIFRQFDNTGKQLLVVTADQKAYLFDTSKFTMVDSTED